MLGLHDATVRIIDHQMQRMEAFARMLRPSEHWRVSRATMFGVVRSDWFEIDGQRVSPVWSVGSEGLTVFVREEW